MVFFCSVIYKYAALTGNEVLQKKLSLEQKEDYVVSSVLLSGILMVSVLGSILFAALLTAVQIITEIKNNAKLRRLKYATTGKWVELAPAGGGDPQAFHLFLSHAWPGVCTRFQCVPFSVQASACTTDQGRPLKSHACSCSRSHAYRQGTLP